MPSIVCHAGSGPNYVWSYCPSLGAAVLFTVLFGLTTLAHTVQSVLHYRKLFALVLVMGGAWETAGYIVRIVSIENQLASNVYTGQLLLILLAPLWINAYIYMLLGRIIHFFLFLEPSSGSGYASGSDRVLGVPARLVTRIFVLCDITAFLIQATGGAMTEPSASPHTQQLGLHIYTAGVGVQLFFLLIFVALALDFHGKLRHRQHRQRPESTELGVALIAGGTAGGTAGNGAGIAGMDGAAGTRDPEVQSLSPSSSPSPSALLPDPRLAIPLLRVLYAVMGLIVFRNIYRLVEFGTGQNSPTVRHEWFAYVFDAVPMFFAFVIINLSNPGKILQGPRSGFSEQDKERKRLRKEKKEAAKRERAERNENENEEEKTRPNTTNDMNNVNNMNNNTIAAQTLPQSQFSTAYGVLK